MPFGTRGKAFVLPPGEPGRQRTTVRARWPTMGRNGLTTLPAWTRAVMVGVMGVTVLASATAVSGGTVAAAESRSFITSDGARLH